VKDAYKKYQQALVRREYRRQKSKELLALVTEKKRKKPYHF